MRPVAFFMRLFIWFSVRHMRKHPGRMLAVLLGIALGAAVFSSVRLSVRASLTAFTRSIEQVTGRADQTLVQPGGRLPETLVPDLLKHPAVAAASPVLTTYVRPLTETADPFLLIGFDPILDRPFRAWQAAASSGEDVQAWLELIKTPHALIIGQELARRYGLQVGDALVLEHARARTPFTIVGVLANQGLALTEGGQVALTDIAAFQEFTGLLGQVDRIDLKLKPGASAQQLSALLPPGVVMAHPEEAQQSGAGMIQAYQLNLSILSFVSLFVGMFLVYSLVALNAAARRGELAILRAMGATARTTFMLFLSEGLLLGGLGWLTAIPISSLMIRYLLKGVSQTISTLFVRVQVDQLTLSAWEVALSFGVTLLVAGVAALQPAHQAMRVPPNEAMSMARGRDTFPVSIRRLGAVGLVSILASWPLSQLPPPEGLPLFGYLATFMLFVGFAMLSPWCLQTAGRLLGPLLRRLGGQPALLAGRYVQEGGPRTAISVGALITAVALFAALVVMIHSFRQTVELWVQQTVSGDLFVRPQMASMNQYRDPLPPDIASRLEQPPFAVVTVPTRRIYLRYHQWPYLFEALDLEAFRQHGGFLWVEGDWATAQDALRTGQGVLISEVFANQTGFKVGDRYELPIPGLQHGVPIMGIVRDYRTRGGVVFFELKQYAHLSGDGRWSAVRYFFKERPKDLDAAVAALRRHVILNVSPQLEVVTGQQMRAGILKIFDETFAITTVLLAIALVIAALGIATTLTVLVLERSVQLNTILAVGGSAVQMRAMILWEAVLMVMVGSVCGLLGGLLLSYLLVFVINRQSFGWTFLYGLDLLTLAAAMPLIFTAALLAALPAVQLVLRQSPAALLRER